MNASKSVYAFCAVVLGISNCILEPKAVAVAPTVTYQFSGVVTEVSAQIGAQILSSTFHVGNPLSGYASLTLAFSNPTETNYNVSNFSATLNNNYTLTATAGGAEVTLNNIVDSFGLSTNTSTGLHGPALNGFSPNAFSIDLFYNSGVLTSTDLLPQFVFDTSTNEGAIEFNSNPFDQVTFTMTDFSVVPEPSTLTLLALGAVGLVVMRRRARC
jgi:PEP-CTERM motif